MKTGIAKTGRSVFIGAVLLFLLIASTSRGATLLWDRNAERDLDGYKVYIVDAGRMYDPVPVKGTTSHSLTNLDAETIYWVYVTAYNTNGLESQPSAVLQYPLGGGCNFSVHPSSTEVSPWPSTGHFRVVTGSTCLWTATANDDWLRITSFSSGQGMTEIFFEADQNTNTVPRIGSIKVADQTFYVQQLAAGLPEVLVHLAPSYVVREGNDIELAVAATGSSELRYQWYLNGVALEGATDSSLMIFGVRPEDEGNYTVTISSAVQTITEGPATLEVYRAPSIPPTGQPVSLGVAVGDAAFFFVDAKGPDLHYQWRKDGETIGLDSPLLYIPRVTSGDFGVYEVLVENTLGSVTSVPARLFEGTPAQLEGRIDIVGAASDVRVQANGVPGDIYEVQASTNLVSWFTIDTLRVDSTGRFEILLPAPAAVDQWFVRTSRRKSQPAP